MSLEELLAASSLLKVAINRYHDACISIKRFSASHRSQPHDAMGPILVNQLSQLAEYEAELRESKVAIAQSINCCSDVSPVSRIPVDILVHIFQLLVNMENELPWSLSPRIPEFPLVLSHVCTAWRRVLSHSPSLWTRIKLCRSPERIEFLKDYIDFHSSQASDAPLYISIYDHFAKGALRIPGLLELVLSFTGRICSLVLELNQSEGADTATSELITACLRASNNGLKHFVLYMVTKRPHRLFMEGETAISTDRDSMPVSIDLPHDKLEDVLSPIVNLWLRGTYFKWESKAYHGLIALRLDQSGSASISELQLTNILASSPRLRSLDVGLSITQATDTLQLPRVYLHNLEHLVGEVLLLKLIQPGPNGLALSIIGGPNQKSDKLYDTEVKCFFSSAHIITFYSDDFLSNLLDICSLLSIAPHLRNLAISHITLPAAGTVHNTIPHGSLDTLYLLTGCHLERSLFREMVSKWSIQRLVFWGENDFIGDTPCYIDSQQALEEDLSDLRTSNIQLDFVPFDPHSEASPIDLFVGPPSIYT